MLVSFSVENYRSFKNRTSLELSPGRSRSKTEHISEDCLKITSIFGANASGKSNLISALRTMKEIVTNPYYHGTEPLYNWDSEDTVTKFEIVFTYESKFQYRYVLEVESISNYENRPSKCIFIYPVRRECLFVSSLDECDKHGNISEDVVCDRETIPHKYIAKNECLAFFGSKESNQILQYHEEISYLRSRVEFYNNINPVNEEAKQFIKRSLGSNSFSQHTYQAKLIEDCRSKDTDKRDKIKIIGFTEFYSDQFFQDLDFIRPGTSDRFYTQLLKYNKIGNNYEWQPQTLCQSLIRMIDNSGTRDNRLLSNARDSLKRKIEDLNEMIETLDIFPSTLRNDSSKGRSKSRYHFNNVMEWFSKDLCILDTSDVYIPGTKEGLESVSTVLDSMDLDIKELFWRPLDEMEQQKVEDDLSVKDLVRLEKTKATLKHALEKLEDVKAVLETAETHTLSAQMSTSLILKTKDGLFRFSFDSENKEGKGEKLQPVSHKGTETDLFTESDGTVRMIELAAILVRSDSSHTFIVDELDRRLHPLLTKRFVELFLEDRSPSKQLIFTTHETEILTTDLFRRDEIWFVDKDENGGSHLEPLDTLGVKSNRNLERIYLGDNSLPGVPRIKDRR